MKYKIGKKYTLKVFTEPEEFEYYGEISSKKFNGSNVSPVFQVFCRISYGRPDLIALYQGKFFVRSYDNTVRGLVKALGENFSFIGDGYTDIKIGDLSLTVEEFFKQAREAGVKKEYIDECISKGYYSTIYHEKCGEIKWCPKCQKIRHTSCSACGCGNCHTCDYRWCCYGPNLAMKEYKIGDFKVGDFPILVSPQIK